MGTRTSVPKGSNLAGNHAGGVCLQDVVFPAQQLLLVAKKHEDVVILHYMLHDKQKRKIKASEGTGHSLAFDCTFFIH